MNKIKEIEENLEENLLQALLLVAEKEGLDLNTEEIPDFEVEVPREKEHGDYATNLALVMTGLFQTSPREIAEKVAANFSSEYVTGVSVAGPGFINFDLQLDWLHEVLDIIIEMGEQYGAVDYGQNKSILLEFVSANPTGPLHVGHSRGAVTGDVLASILKKAGFSVHTEYYINNAGNQIDILGQSVLIRYRQELGQDCKMPEDCYSGAYIKEIARELKDKYGTELLDYSAEKRDKICREFAYESMLELIREDLLDFGIEFDSWFSEKELHNGKIEQAIDVLRDKGYIYEKEGAVWFEASAFLDEKDRVVIKSDGSPTYLAADIAYHYNKLERGYDQLINIWGADHHGYIPRIKSVIEAMDYDPQRLEVLIVQLVNLLKDGEKIQMSKRSGNFVTMRDVLKEVGRDAARYFYIMRSSESHLDFDLDLAKEESTNNPVYYVQYAHARIHSIMDNLEGENELKDEEICPEVLTSPEEVELMKLLARYPEEIRISAASRQPHHITSYAHDLASAFHIFYNKCRVITDDKQLSKARVYLIKAVRQVLQNVLSLMGLEAPRQM
ncbi:MAG: arginine--tRNA ligase [bacterium]